MNNRHSKVTYVDAYTLDEIILCGMKSNKVLINEMPWSFEFAGMPVSHETDDLYLIGGAGLHMSHKDVLLIYRNLWRVDDAKSANKETVLAQQYEVMPIVRFVQEYTEDV